MNPSYLMYYVSSHLRTNVRWFSYSKGLLSENVYPAVGEHPSWTEDLFQILPAAAIPRDYPVLIDVDQNLPHTVYCVVPTVGNIYLIGPCRPNESMEYLHRLPDLTAARQKAAAASGTNRPSSPKNPYARYLASLIQKAAGRQNPFEPSFPDGPASSPAGSGNPGSLTESGESAPGLSREHLQEPSEGNPVSVFSCSLNDLAECALLLYYWDSSAPESSSRQFLTPTELLETNSTQSEHTKRVWKSYNKILLSNMEHGIIHNPYNQEIREYTAVENGDVEEVKRIQKEDYTSRQGVLSPDPVRNEISMGIVIITLARSAAARGGVSPEACYSLSDASIREMESCKDVGAIRQIARSTELRYTMLARAAKQTRGSSGDVSSTHDNPHISHCKDYIFTHLNRKLTVQQIADAIGLETNYLSSLFHRCENITLKQYILREKINLAKNMLAYSPYSYIEIANYLGFSSQSHMGEQFRRMTGLTMRQYRERYSKEDFLQDIVTSESRIS